MKRTEVLKAAEKAVNGQRDQAYGKPENNFAIIADLWSAYKGVPFTRLDVASMMACVKLARIRTGPEQADSFVDLAGYAACAAEVAEFELKK